MIPLTQKSPCLLPNTNYYFRNCLSVHLSLCLKIALTFPSAIYTSPVPQLPAVLLNSSPLPRRWNTLSPLRSWLYKAYLISGHMKSGPAAQPGLPLHVLWLNQVMFFWGLSTLGSEVKRNHLPSPLPTPFLFFSGLISSILHFGQPF